MYYMYYVLRVCVLCVYVEHPLFPVCRLVPRWETPKKDRRGVVPARWRGENKLISLTQPAVTPPQHDINPKPRLSLFKLYESLRRRIRGGNSLWEALYPSLSFRHTLSFHIPSLVGYKQEYVPSERREKFSLLPCGIFTTRDICSNII